MTDRPLTINTVVKLAQIVEAAIYGRKVGRLVHEYVVEGTARSIGDDQGYHARDTDDIRDCWLRVTTTGGLEAFWPISELLEELGETFIADYAGAN